MQVQKMYRRGGNWHDITLDDLIAQTEILGFYDRGTVETLLARGEEIRTPYAVFRAVGITKRRFKPYECRKYIRRFG
jgi:hypothetical protein